MIWSIDGIAWNYPCTIERTAEIEASEISGLMLNKTYYNDVIGTYMQYQIALAVPRGEEGTYDTIYELLTNPSPYHTFVLPYGQTTITINARVQNVSDKWVKRDGNGNYWRGLRFTCLANEPNKRISLGELVAAGMTPYPDNASAQIGDTYMYTSGGWVPYSIPDGDDVYY